MFERQPVNKVLLALIRKKKLDRKSGSSHGHYISALDAILNLERRISSSSVEDEIRNGLYLWK